MFPGVMLDTEIVAEELTNELYLIVRKTTPEIKQRN